MARRNPDVVRLEAEVENLRRLLADRLRDPGDLPVRGCGDNSCVVAKPGGMGTNGGCCCEARELRHALSFWKRRAGFLEQSIRELRDRVLS